MLGRQRRLADQAARAVAADGERLALARERLAAEVRRELARPRSLIAALALGIVAGAVLLPRATRRSRPDGPGDDTAAPEARRVAVQRLGTAALTVARLMDAYLSAPRR
ncbi:MAG TPA: hypothetical protein VIN61_00925 [Gammaproteobacteria bacterium]